MKSWIHRDQWYKVWLTKLSDTNPVTSGPSAAPSDPVPSMMAVTVALAFWLSLNDLWVPYNQWNIYIPLSKNHFITYKITRDSSGDESIRAINK